MRKRTGPAVSCEKKEMARMKDYLFPLNEAHVRLNFDGEALHLDGLPEGPDSVTLPEVYRRGLLALYNLLESLVPGLSCISVLGVWFAGAEASPFVAFDLWAQREGEGFYLPMATSASLFQENGIPYFHKPLI